MIKSAQAAEQFGFRFRLLIFLALYVAGFLAPSGLGGRGSTLWLAAATWAARSGWMGVANATFTVTCTALACLAAGAIVRVWGTAYLGSAVMLGGTLQGDCFVAGGPYRYLRNPLYLGSWLLAVGTSILMPLGGAAFFLPAFSLFTLFLIRAEEHFLTAKLGDAYQQYRQRVPRLLPRWATISADSASRPHWGPAVLAEIYPLTFALCFAVWAWNYNARILLRCLLVCYGGSLVMRALTSRSRTLADGSAQASRG